MVLGVPEDGIRRRLWARCVREGVIESGLRGDKGSGLDSPVVFLRAIGTNGHESGEGKRGTGADSASQGAAGRHEVRSSVGAIENESL